MSGIFRIALGAVALVAFMSQSSNAKAGEITTLGELVGDDLVWSFSYSGDETEINNISGTFTLNEELVLNGDGTDAWFGNCGQLDLGAACVTNVQGTVEYDLGGDIVTDRFSGLPGAQGGALFVDLDNHIWRIDDLFLNDIVLAVNPITTATSLDLAFGQSAGKVACLGTGTTNCGTATLHLGGSFVARPLTAGHAVPEPTTLALLGLGLLGAGVARRRKMVA